MRILKEILKISMRTLKEMLIIFMRSPTISEQIPKASMVTGKKGNSGDQIAQNLYGNSSLRLKSLCPQSHPENYISTAGLKAKKTAISRSLTKLAVDS